MDSGSLELDCEACSLVNGMNGLQLSLSSSPRSPLSPAHSLPLSTMSSSSSEDLLTAAGSAYHLDAFLQEALSSRNRITVLRLEQEIEKFAANSTRQQLSMRPMQSSYERLAAHRVAQYYNLQSMAVETNGSSGSRIVLLKTPESKLPSIRLVDIPVALTQIEKLAAPPLGRVAIKQRASGAINNSDASFAGRMTPRKSVEERTEEYNRARARIFSSPDLANGRDSQVGMYLREEQHTMGELPLTREVMPIGAERDHYEDEAAFRAASRVAVFRDREKDIKDPDYDRSYGRYSPPLKTGMVTSVKPLVTHGTCAPSSGMISQTMTQGGTGSLQQTRVQSAFYPAFDNQSGPWTGLTGLPVLGYPCALPGTYTQGHPSTDTFLPAQKLVHPQYHTFANWRQLPSKINSQPMPSGHVMEWYRSY